MELSGIDIVSLMYRTLNVPILRQALGEGKLWQHNIPRNSPYTEVTISIPLTSAYESELRFFDIDIRTPNLKDFYPHEPISEQDNTFPDLARFKEITDIILPLIDSVGVLLVETKVPGVPTRDADGTWRVNIRVEFTILDTSDESQVSLVESVGQPDGKGGYAPISSVVWRGAARRENIVQSPHLDITAGVYGLYLRCSWLIPAEEAPAPKKNMRLVSEDGEYIITGIFPEGIFWRLTTTRNDQAYA